MTVTYENGEKVEFVGEKFDIDPAQSVSNVGNFIKYTYTDWNGAEAAFYMNPTKVSGIIVVPFK